MSTGTTPQLTLPIADLHIHRMRAAQLAAACRQVAIAREYAVTANELDAIFEPIGHPVSLGTLHNTLGDHERHYFRGEWIPFFASLNEDVAAIVAAAAGRVLAPADRLRPEDELALLKERLVTEFGAAGARLVAGFQGGRRK